MAAKVLQFTETIGTQAPMPKKDALPLASRSLGVTRVSLATGEGLPLLVDWSTWLPVSLAMRWVVFARRYECAESTLRTNLAGIAVLYRWGDHRFPEGLEARLESGASLDHADLLDLRETLRVGGRENAVGVDDPATAGAKALAVQLFLRWTLNPAARNAVGAAPTDALDRARQIDAVLGPLARHAGVGQPGTPIDADVATRIDAMIAPLQREDGRWQMPLTWGQENPFRPATRLRNWLLWSIARDCGLRIGELLTLRLDDFMLIRGAACLRVVRRPDDSADVRARRPHVKTTSRHIPTSDNVEFARQAYLKENGRRGGRVLGSPYLFTSQRGRPLSSTSADRVTARLRRATGAQFSWHSLRHAWADDIARKALMGHQSSRDGHTFDPARAEEMLITELRILGGWSLTSTMPMLYAKRALTEFAHARLRERQDERAQRITEYRQNAERGS